jgi:hypothetical protein
MNNSGWNMYVFRDGRRTVSGSELLSSLTAALGCWRNAPEDNAGDCALQSLIAAGGLECALADSAKGSSNQDSCNVVREITEALACAFLSGDRRSLSSISQQAECILVAASYEVAVQEGFAYYALHPRKVAMLLDSLPLKSPVAVLGIRSIGVTLSAVAYASLHLRGIECQRFTVRPTGHPYNRQLKLTPEFCAWIESSREAEFLVVDEGPGISGSSFLAVAEALATCGVEGGRIHLIGSRAVDPATLRAEDAAERWAHFHFHVMQNAPLPPVGAGESLSGGIWRRHFDGEGPSVPGSWASLEAAKFLAPEQSIFKFEGFGHYGEAIGDRAKLLAASGFSPRYLGNRCGFGQYELVPGRSLDLSDRSPEVLERMADYLALRSTAFATNTPQTPELERMLRWNWKLEFDEELRSDESRLCPARVVVCDGRMMPHEWLRTTGGKLLKLDAGNHGDNHYFPGPCDIAWDVAGVIVEWELHGEECDRFVREYETRSGDAIGQRLAPYLLAYTIFSLGWSKMAALAMQGEYDESLLERDYQRYRKLATRLRQSQTLPGVLRKTEGPASTDPTLHPA